jgi:hypothetical protein
MALHALSHSDHSFTVNSSPFFSLSPYTKLFGLECVTRRGRSKSREEEIHQGFKRVWFFHKGGGRPRRCGSLLFFVGFVLFLPSLASCSLLFHLIVPSKRSLCFHIGAREWGSDEGKRRGREDKGKEKTKGKDSILGRYSIFN